MDKMLDVKIEMSTEIGKLAKALALFQGDMPEVPHNKDVRYKGVGYTYADLDSILHIARPRLMKVGLTLVQSVEVINSQKYQAAMLVHESGQWIKTFTPIVGQSANMKEMGGNMTYARRYGVCALLGISSDEDKDNEQIVREQQDSKVVCITPAQVSRLKAAVGDDMDLHEEILQSFRVGDLTEIPASSWANIAAEMLRRKGKEL